VVVVIWGAHLLPPGPFGVFALMYTVATFAIGLSRGAVSGPALLLLSGARTSKPTSVLLASAVQLTTLGSLPVCVLAAAGLISWQPSAAVGVIVVSIPFLLVQDVCRYLAPTLQRPGVALGSDVLWLLLLTAGLLLSQGRLDGPAELMALWSVCGAVSLVAFRPLLRGLRRADADHRWLARTLLPASRRTLGEYLAVAGSGQAVLVVTGAALSASATGALRGAYSLYGPLNVLFSASILALLPEMRRFVTSDRVRTARALGFASIATLTSLAGLYLLAVHFVFGQLLLRATGDTGRQIDTVATAIGVRYLATAVIVGAGLYVRGFGYLRLTMRVQIVAAPIQALTAATSCLWLDVRGVAWVMAAVETVTALVYIVAVIRLKRPIAVFDEEVVSAGPLQVLASDEVVQFPRPTG
jgi:hypothetical protein